MPDRPAYPLQIFYDGSCSVCAAEMKIYRSKEHAGRLKHEVRHRLTIA